MKSLKEHNVDGRLVKPEDLARLNNMSRAVLMRTARDADAVVKLGRSVFIDQEAFYDYIAENCKA